MTINHLDPERLTAASVLALLRTVRQELDDLDSIWPHVHPHLTEDQFAQARHLTGEIEGAAIEFNALLNRAERRES
jgi:hypothetical protein